MVAAPVLLCRRWQAAHHAAMWARLTGLEVQGVLATGSMRMHSRQSSARRTCIRDNAVAVHQQPPHAGLVAQQGREEGADAAANIADGSIGMAAPRIVLRQAAIGDRQLKSPPETRLATCRLGGAVSNRTEITPPGCNPPLAWLRSASAQRPAWHG